MTYDQRTRGKLGTPGPFLAEITSHFDPTYMGGLEVALIKGVASSSTSQSDTYIVRYLSPFYGVTSSRHQGNTLGEFNDVQKSYGMWMVPPDVGTMVMVIFIDGDPNQGYWMGCVQDIFQNHMVPGIAASENTEMTQEQKSHFGTTFLPVAEYNKITQGTVNNINSIKKPVHPFAEQLLKQGLITDTIRGVSTSSARREVPSNVFGISTPGPIDVSSPSKQSVYDKNKLMPVSRLGGSTFVMDDGDISGQNELVRIRTRTGHQILLHNTADLVYIANSKGTAWIELTSNGKIDIYAKDSISIHTENDFNFCADRDINLEAGRNINMKSIGNTAIESSDSFSLIVGRDGKLLFGTSYDHTVNGDYKLVAEGSLNFTGDSNNLTSLSGTNIKSAGNLTVNASRVNLNGSAVAATAEIASVPVVLSLFSLPSPTTDIISIVPRVPTNEPWPGHETIAVSNLNSGAGPAYTSTVAANDTITVAYNKLPAIKGVPPAATGNKENDNLAAFLWMIRVCEGTSSSTGYQTMFTGKLFSIDNPAVSSYQYKEHPNILNVAGRFRSTAAGAYQFLYRTWKECKAGLKLPDFSPASQDKAAIFLLKRRRAYDDVIKGNFVQAVAKCNKEWASLPNSPYDQNPKNINVALSLYKQGGGTVA